MANEDVYQIKITLRHSRPPIWRRIQVAGDTKLGKLHRIIQATMGWTNSHMHQFFIDDDTYGVSDSDFPNETKSERNARLDRVATEGDTLMYEYDFGDSWEHDLHIEKVLPAAAGTRYPVCLAGQRACPPEDCGGIPGYERLLEILRDPEDEEYAEMIEWLGDPFDPEGFDLNTVNRVLKSMR